MKLYIFPPSGRVLGIVALKNYLALDCGVQPIDLGRGDQLTPRYLALNPNKKMPTLEDDGFVLWESNAILFYMAAKRPSSGLWPSDLKCQADVLRWLAWESAHWDAESIGMVSYEKASKAVLDRGSPDPLLLRAGSRISPASRQCSTMLSEARLGSSASGSLSRIFRSEGLCPQPNSWGFLSETIPKSFAGSKASPRCRLGRRHL
jgi:hypothetical protein